MIRNHIAFVGDSFCGSYDEKEWKKRQHAWQIGTTEPAWPSLIAERLKLYGDYHGYCGKSWWYSRSYFYKNCTKLLNSNRFAAIIFCHTDTTRMNNQVESLVNIMNPKTVEEKIIKNAQDLWKGYLYDEEHQVWCQEMWLQEIKHKFKNVPKIIQFSNFKSTLFNQDNYSGMCFKTPLVWIQLGRYLGTEKEISKAAVSEVLANHLNDKNNLIMADFIIDAMNNYQPGVYDIDLTKFDQTNSGAPCTIFGY